MHIQRCVASSTSEQKAREEMRDFDLLRATRRGSEVYEQARASTIHGRAEIGDFTRGGSARCECERAPGDVGAAPLDRTGSRIPTAPDNGTTQPLSIAG